MQRVDSIVEQVQALDGIETAPHRFGGVEFQIEGREVGHIHRNGLVDIPFHKKIKTQLLAEGKANDHHILPEAGWISFHVRSDADIENAVWLFKLAYIYTIRTMQRQNRVPAGIIQDAVIESLPMSEDMRAILNGLWG
ncbi:MAG: DUF5519 family protein [Chloroflexi bacterium]|nr:DUF5519 family protein [Chloroflexota bacterium]